MFDKQAFFQKKELPREQAELGGQTVFVQRLDFQDYVKWIENGKDMTKLVVLTVINEDGTRVFSDADAEALKQKDWQELDEVAAQAWKINQYSVEDAKKNSKETASSEEQSS
jgi:mannose/fructose/N-acetylgalactosamine-specific phosphotransferase system component IIB